MADKRISQLVDRGTVVNSDVVPIVVSGAVTTNKATISSIQTFMQGNLDLGVTSVGITIGTSGTNVSVSGSPVTSSGNITINIPTASATNRGALSSADWSTFNSKVSSVGLSMPSAFSVANSPITGSGTIAVTGAGTVSQYIRGDGSLADFPQGGGGGGASVSYYLNGSVSQGTIGGIAYLEMNKTPILGAGTDFTIAADGYIASFITDAGDPALLEIPAGNWNFETYFQASSSGGTPSFYVELYKVNSGGTATLIASSSANPELIAFGTSTTPYFSALAVPTTVLTITDRLAIRYYVVHSGRTITLHTENGNLCQINTTFTTGLTALNGLTAQVQNFATGTSGTDFNISSSVATHTFNIPSASATNRGLVTTGAQTIAGNKTTTSNIDVNGVMVGRGASSGDVFAGIGGNTAVGTQALLSITTGFPNTALGSEALRNITTGVNNIGIGSEAGKLDIISGAANATSNSSIYIGNNSRPNSNGGSNEIVIGNNGAGSGSNTVTIGNSLTTQNYFTGNIRGGAFIKSGGTSSQFLMADGSVNTSVLTSGAYLPLAGGTMTGILNVPSDFLRIAAEGASNITILRNFTGTAQGQSGFNNIGFNNSNNFYFTKNLNNGAIFAFTNTSYQTYTLQNASGTLAFTSDLGAYLPLSGGTLTGALNGTSASFTGAVTSTTNEGFIIAPSSGASYINYKIGATSYSLIGVAGATNDFITGSALGDLNIRETNSQKILFSTNNGASPCLTLASTGAATFSSSVGVGGSPTNRLTALASETGTQITTIPVAKFANTGNAFSKVVIGSDNANFDGVISMDNNATLANTKLRFYIGNGTNSTAGHSNDQIVLQGNGNVGIGTASPDRNLELETTGDTYFRLTGSRGNADELHVGNLEFYNSNSSTLVGEIRGITGTGGTQSNSGQLAFYTNNAGTYAERMRITSAGNTEIRSGNILNIYRTDNTRALQLYVTGSECVVDAWAATSEPLMLRSNGAGGRIVFHTNGAEQVRINPDGDLIIKGTLADFTLGGSGAEVFFGRNATNYITANGGASATIRIISNTNGVELSNGATSWVAVSDENLKEMSEWKPFENSVEKIISLRAGTSRYKTDEEETSRSFLIAQDVKEVLPEAVSEYEDGTLGLRYTEVIPLLVAAIQELKTEIDSLKNQIQNESNA